MKSGDETERYIFHTHGVCPPEIHFKLQKGVLHEVRFVGGGCPGNAQLVSRLLQGKPINEVLKLLIEIDCRNGTSCPDQLAKALIGAKDGALDPARSFRHYADPQPRSRIGLIGDLEGRREVLESLIHDMRKENVENIYCLGNLTGGTLDNKQLLAFVRKQGILAIQGELDFQYAQGEEPGDCPPLEQKDRDYLVRLPHVISFQLGEKEGVAFFGRYIQDFPGFSDFEPFALEMNMVCNLTNFLQDESVFPALEAMVPQFEAQIILFGQIKTWGHWHVGGAHFISVGPSWSDDGLAWGLLEESGGGVDFKIMKIRQ